MMVLSTRAAFSGGARPVLGFVLLLAVAVWGALVVHGHADEHLLQHADEAGCMVLVAMTPVAVARALPRVRRAPVVARRVVSAPAPRAPAARVPEPGARAGPARLQVFLR